MTHHGVGRVRALLLAATFAAGGAGAAELQVEVSGLASLTGTVHISVYDSDKQWLGEGTVQRQAVDIEAALSDGLVKATLELPPGDYALSLYYDVNGNGTLDANFIGIPKEPVALSNNAKPSFGPPKYKDAVFTLGEEGGLQRIDMVAMD